MFLFMNESVIIIEQNASVSYISHHNRPHPTPQHQQQQQHPRSAIAMRTQHAFTVLHANPSPGALISLPGEYYLHWVADAAHRQQVLTWSGFTVTGCTPTHCQALPPIARQVLTSPGPNTAHRQASTSRPCSMHIQQIMHCRWFTMRSHSSASNLANGIVALSEAFTLDGPWVLPNLMAQPSSMYIHWITHCSGAQLAPSALRAC